MEYTIKRIDKSQLLNLKMLFGSVYHKNSLDLEGIEERFNTSYFGLEYVGYIAYENKDCIGMPAAYYGVFPMIASFKGKKILCAQSGDTMTHKNHRKKGLFTRLAKITYDTAKKEGVEFVFGFPSTSSFPGFKHKLDWVFPFEMIKFTRLVTTLPIGIIKKKLQLKTGNFNYFAKKYLKYINTNISKNTWGNKEGHYFEILRDQNYKIYKSSLNNNKFFLNTNNITFFLKYDGNISIGSILGSINQKSLEKSFKYLDILAFLSGSVQIRSYFSPNSSLNNVLPHFGRLSKAMPYGFKNLTNKYDPSKLELSFLDYDYF